jgi:hypothetical protein
LAKIEVADNNCEKAAELVRDLDTNTVYGSDIKKVNEQCHVQQRHVVVNTETKQQKGKAAVFMWRVFSGIITAGGLGAGYFINTMINDKITEYQQRSETWLGYTTNQSARISTDMIAKEKTEIDNLHTQIETFKLYRNVSYGAGGIGAASLTLSIVIPIISKK